ITFSLRSASIESSNPIVSSYWFVASDRHSTLGMRILILDFSPRSYKDGIDADRTPLFGLVAEEVEKLNPDLITRDEGGKPYTVGYEAVNAMLLNEFLKEHRKVQEQGATIAGMKKQIEALAATVQKVSNQLQLGQSEADPVAQNP